MAGEFVSLANREVSRVRSLRRHARLSARRPGNSYRPAVVQDPPSPCEVMVRLCTPPLIQRGHGGTHAPHCTAARGTASVPGQRSVNLREIRGPCRQPDCGRRPRRALLTRFGSSGLPARVVRQCAPLRIRCRQDRMIPARPGRRLRALGCTDGRRPVIRAPRGALLATLTTPKLRLAGHGGSEEHSRLR